MMLLSTLKRIALAMLLVIPASGLFAQVPTLVTCGDPPIDEAYCYVNSDSHSWHWQSSDGSALSLIFSSGTIESASYDHLRIYNGPDNSTAPIYDHVGAAENLAGLTILAGTDIYMEMTSDGSVSCSSGSQTSWAWQVGCMDCVQPVATFSVVTDCDAQSFNVEVNITVLGSDTELEVINDAGVAAFTVSDIGSYVVGPFPITTEVNVTLVNDANSLCNLSSGLLTNPLCPSFVACGEPAVEDSYCYGYYDSHAWHWQNTDPDGTLAIQFVAGTIDYPGLYGDNIYIYSGVDNSGTLLYSNLSFADLAGLQFNTTGPDLFMEMNSINSGYGSCSDGLQTEWEWVVGCYDCEPPVANFEVVTDCDAQSFMIQVDLTDMGSQSTLQLTNDLDANVVDATGTGTYMVGPFPITSLVSVTVVNDTNALCNLHSPVLTNPLCPMFVQCGEDPIDEIYCYQDNDSHNWHWQSSDGSALSLIFSSGTIESASFDHLRIYNGPDNSTTPIYDHVGGAENLAGLTITAGTDIYMEMSSDGSVSCASGSQTSWAWQVGCMDCVQPVATFNVVTDCDAQSFNVEVHLTVLGSDIELDVVNDAGAPAFTVSDTGLYVVGPFPITTEVVVTLENDDNSLCNLASAMLTNPLCPTFVVCGEPALEDAYCYGYYDSHAWHWQNTDPDGTLAILFTAGTIDYPGLYGDNISIYSGVDNSGTLLYANLSFADLAGMQFNTTGPDLYMEMNSINSGYGSCSDGMETEWEWVVGCLDCTAPVATYTVNTDCDAQNFTIDVDVSVLGSDNTLDITNDAGAPMVTATEAGVYTVGPFAITTEVNITLTNEFNSLCNIHSPLLTNPLCPSHVVCGEPALEDAYCYGYYDFHAWHWQNTDPDGTLAILFTAGTIDYPGLYGDNIFVYNGPDNLSPLLYQNLSFADLAGMQFNTTGPDLYMEMNTTNSGYGSCSDGLQTEWEWVVGCLDCTAPQATYTVVTDCEAMQYNVDVNITDLGSDAVIDITNDGGVAPMPATAPGTYSVGPFPAGGFATITLVNDANSLCNVNSGPLTNPLCPTVLACGVDPISETYCYTDYDNHTWHWQCGCGSPLSMLFSSGSIESDFWDDLRIYDGPDNTGTILFEHIGSTEDLTGLLVISTSSDIYMEMTSDGSGSCSSGSFNTWNWTVGCLDCTSPTVSSYSVVPDCLHHSYQIAVNVTNTGSSSTVRIANTATADTLENVGAGITLVGPIPMDSVSMLTVLNATNGLCHVYSSELTYSSMECVIEDCAATEHEYCYTDADTAWFIYQGDGSLPMTITFHSGQLLLNDKVQIFDGFNTSVAPMWEGTQNGDVTGLAKSSIGPENALTLRVISDDFASCAGGQADIPLTWTSACGYVGIDEEGHGELTMYPNPTNGELYLRLPPTVNGSTEMRIVDVAGRIVHQETFTPVGGATNTFDLHGLQSGNYTVVITTGAWVKAQQLQIMH